MTHGGLEARDQELIAAFIDGRMVGEERRAFMRRLDEEEVLYEVFVETVRYHDQQAGRPATVVEHPAARRRWSRLAAIAAVVAVAVATPVVLRNLGGKDLAERLAESDGLGPALGEGWYEQGWSRTRGVKPGGPEGDAAFRVGVQALDLEVALRLGRDREAVILTRRLERELGAVELSQPLQLCYEAIRELVEGGAPGDEALALSRSTECVFSEQFPDLAAANRLGGWTEVGRLAARAGDRELLASRRFQRALRDLAPGEWDPKVATALDEIAALLAAPADRLDLARLEAAFTAILDSA